MARRQDQQDTSDDRRIRKLEADMRKVQEELKSKNRNNTRQASSRVRFGRTVTPDGETYPVYQVSPSLVVNPRTYWVAFDDITHDKSVGDYTAWASATLTSRESPIIAFDPFGGYILEGFPVICMPQNGYWIIIRGQLEIANASNLAPMTLAAPIGGDTTVLVNSECGIHNISYRVATDLVPDPATATLPTGSRLLIKWRGPTVFDTYAGRVGQWELLHVFVRDDYTL